MRYGGEYGLLNNFFERSYRIPIYPKKIGDLRETYVSYMFSKTSDGISINLNFSEILGIISINLK